MTKTKARSMYWQDQTWIFKLFQGKSSIENVLVNSIPKTCQDLVSNPTQSNLIWVKLFSRKGIFFFVGNKSTRFSSHVRTKPKKKNKTTTTRSTPLIVLPWSSADTMENPHEQTHNALLSRIINNMVCCISYNNTNKLETDRNWKQQCILTY